MNSQPIVKMFGPSISDPTKIVNRDVPACDEQAYFRAGYRRGSITDIPEVPKPLVIGSEEISLEEEPLEAPKPKLRKEKVKTK